MAKVLSKRVLEDVRFQNDIADVIGAYINLQRAGTSFKGLCPFHKEKTPSFHVNTQRQIFHCFGCGAGGDVFKFLMQHEGLDFIGAVRMLAQRAGIALELDDEGEGKSDKLDLYRVHKELSLFYRRCLEQMDAAQAARDYVKKRGLDGENAAAFLIGYAPDRWDTCASWAAKNKVDPALLEKAGLVVLPEQSERRTPYDRFRNRVMFPIFDEQSRVIAFSGRALVEGERTAKYVNSPETPLFHKGRVLYALHAARRHIVDSREAIVCEGQIDVIRCHLAGFQTAVASQGTAFTEDHARVLRRYADSVVLVFDPDRAGEDAAVRTAGTFLDAGLSVRVAALPAGDDPDSFILKKGAEAFAAVLKSAQSIVGFQIGVAGRREDLRNEAAMRRAVKAVFTTVAKTADSVQRDALLQELGRAFPSLNMASLFEGFRLQQLKAGGQRRDAPAEQAPAPAPEIPREEEELCKHLSHFDEDAELAALVRDNLPPAMLSHDVTRAFISAVLRAAAGGLSLDVALNGNGRADPAMQEFAARVQMAPSMTAGIRVGRTSVREPEFTRKDAVCGLILFLWKRRFEQERQHLQEIMKVRELTAEESEHRRQLGYDIKAVSRWETGANVIAALADQDA